MLKYDAGFGIALAVSHHFVHIVIYIRPVIFSLYSVIHTTLSRVNGKKKKVWQVEEALSLWLRHELLKSFINRCTSGEHSFFLKSRFRFSLTKLFGGVLTQFNFADWVVMNSTKVGGVVPIPIALVTNCASVLVCASNAKTEVFVSSLFSPLPTTSIYGSPW